MRLTVIFAAAVVAVVAADKKAPVTYPQTATVDATCARVWAPALQAYMAKGFGPKGAGGTSREAGILDMEYRQGAQVTGAFGNVNKLVGEFTTQKSTGVMTQYTGFRIDGATLVMVDNEGKCELNARHTYAGFEKRLQGTNWWVLATNGKMENDLLAEIKAAVEK